MHWIQRKKGRKKEELILRLWTGVLLYQFSSVTQSYLTLCDPMNCSTPGLPVHHQPLEFFQTHVHWVGDVWRLHWLLHSEEVLFKRIFHCWCYVLNSWLLETALPENSYKAHITSCCIPKNPFSRTSLVVQWLRLCAPKAESWGLIPAQGTRSHMLQLRVHRLKLRPGTAK